MLWRSGDFSAAAPYDAATVSNRALSASMIDNPRITQRLLTLLESALPFEIDLTQRLSDYLKEQEIATEPPYIVSKVSYAGDEGGIICHLDGLVVSLTQVRVSRPVRLALAVAKYHNRRVKKLRELQTKGG